MSAGSTCALSMSLDRNVNDIATDAGALRTKRGLPGRCSQVVMRAEYVCGDCGGEVGTILILVCAGNSPALGDIACCTSGWERGNKSAPILNVDETLRVRVAEVRLMRKAEVDLCLVERVFDLVGIYAG